MIKADKNDKEQENYLILGINIGSQDARGLLDTGAQPSVLKESLVPPGTPIIKQKWFIKGVQGPKIEVIGSADIPIQIGDLTFIQNCLIIEDKAIDFPANTDLIIGTNFIVLNQLDIVVSNWALYQKGRFIQHLEPSYVDGVLFGADQDYIQHCSDFTAPQSKLEGDGNRRVDESCSSFDEGPENIVRKPRLQKNKSVRFARFYPEECMLKENLPEENFKPEVINIPPPQQSNKVGQPQIVEYDIACIANVEIPSKQMCFVEVAVLDGEGRTAPKNGSYTVNGGLMAPGAIAIDGVIDNKGRIAIMNFNAENLQLQRGIPIVKARKIEEPDMLTVGCNAEDIVKKPDLYTLMAISSITEEAYVSSEEYNSEPDNLQEALQYDPTTITTKEVVYDEKRWRKLLKMLRADTWKLTKQQRRAIEEVLFYEQESFNLEGEPLPLTNVLQHDIQLIDENKVVFVKPRWTPIHQRPSIEAEVKA